jgi:Fe2+ transport system protein FeoA
MPDRTAAPAETAAAARVGTLARAAIGATVTVAGVLGDPVVRGRLLSLGIGPGASLSVTRGGRGGPLVVALGAGQVMVDARTSDLILVHERRDPASGRVEGLVDLDDLVDLGEVEGVA